MEQTNVVRSALDAVWADGDRCSPVVKAKFLVLGSGLWSLDTLAWVYLRRFARK